MLNLPLPANHKNLKVFSRTKVLTLTYVAFKVPGRLTPNYNLIHSSLSPKQPFRFLMSSQFSKEC